MSLAALAILFKAGKFSKCFLVLLAEEMVKSTLKLLKILYVLSEGLLVMARGQVNFSSPVCYGKFQTLQSFEPQITNGHLSRTKKSCRQE